MSKPCHQKIGMVINDPDIQMEDWKVLSVFSIGKVINGCVFATLDKKNHILQLNMRDIVVKASKIGKS